MRPKSVSRMPVRTSLFVALLSFCLAVVVGCGGGGGGTVPGGGEFRYETVWTAGTSNSQVVSLLNQNEIALTTRVLNRGGETAFNVTDLADGTYQVDASLYSGTDGSGVRVGRLRAFVEIDNNQVLFRSASGGASAGVVVTPTSATIALNGSKQFAANLRTSTGEALFTLDTFDWLALGGVATVTTEGLATATATGSGSIRATHNPSSLRGTASLTVSPFNPTRTKWTVLVYLNAANDLFTFSNLNVNQMEEVAGNADVRFVLQWKQSRDVDSRSTFDGTRRVVVTPDNTSTVVSPVVQDMGDGVDMGRWQTLRDFIAWGKQYYPADRTVLVIWNHGNGWLRSANATLSRAVSYDDETGNSIQTDELPLALAGNVFDILAFDASLMQMLEVAYEIRSHARYIAGSEESPPGEGYPYHLIFDGFRDNPDQTTAALSEAFVNGMLEYPPYVSRQITQSVIDPTRLPALVTAVDNLAAAMIANSAQLTVPTRNARNNAQSYKPTLSRYFRDLWDLCRVLIADANTPAPVKTAAASVQTAVENAVLHEGHNSNSPNSHGISIDFSPSTFFSSVQTDYGRLDLAADSRWDEWLRIAP